MDTEPAATYTPGCTGRRDVIAVYEDNRWQEIAYHRKAATGKTESLTSMGERGWTDRVHPPHFESAELREGIDETKVL